ncbi:hypothetical protein AC579_648 [Pseudocercospora musae]|uniref:Ecp2 effector protein domain-containing protein n=1 Tax=Pseudocercospora musae TaxID=113226 RepID=A0A139I8Q6_9PEZI|nr:hypothetical protein AC579_648 [Pseudocercospora musae]
MAVMLRFTTLILLAILSVDIASARTGNIRVKALQTDPPVPNTQTCAGKPYTSGWAFYSTTIIVPYSDGVGCENVKNHLIVTIGDISSPRPQLQSCDVTPAGSPVICNWRCLSAYGGTGTELDFAAPRSQAEHINQALAEEYAMVEGGFDCPKFT